jgi:hypothetical protein
MTGQDRAELGEVASARVLGVAEKEEPGEPGGVVEAYPGAVVLEAVSGGGTVVQEVLLCERGTAFENLVDRRVEPSSARPVLTREEDSDAFRSARPFGSGYLATAGESQYEVRFAAVAVYVVGEVGSPTTFGVRSLA